MVIRRWKATLPQAKLSGHRGTATRPKPGKRASFGGNPGTGGRK